MLVDPLGADVTPTDRSIWYGAGPEPEDRNPPRFPPGQNPKGQFVQVEWSGPGHNFRYTEERIYANDPVFAQGEVAVGEIDQASDEFDEDDSEENDETESSEPRSAGDLVQEATDDDNARMASLAGKRYLRAPSSRRLPFLIATTSPAAMTAIYQWAIIGSLLIAAFGVAIVGWLIWMRYW
jgi:hypothetical protein